MVTIPGISSEGPGFNKTFLDACTEKFRFLDLDRVL